MLIEIVQCWTAPVSVVGYIDVGMQREAHSCWWHLSEFAHCSHSNFLALFRHTWGYVVFGVGAL